MEQNGDKHTWICPIEALVCKCWTYDYTLDQLDAGKAVFKATTTKHLCPMTKCVELQENCLKTARCSLRCQEMGLPRAWDVFSSAMHCQSHSRTSCMLFISLEFCSDWGGPWRSWYHERVPWTQNVLRSPGLLNTTVLIWSALLFPFPFKSWMQLVWGHWFSYHDNIIDMPYELSYPIRSQNNIVYKQRNTMWL